MMLRGRSNLTRDDLQSRAIYLRGFIYTDTPPTPFGTDVASPEPPMDLQTIRSLFSPEARPFVISAALRSAFIDTHRGDARGRFDLELFDLAYSPPRLTPSVFPATPSLISTTTPSSSASVSPLYFVTATAFSITNRVIPTFLFVFGDPKTKRSIGRNAPLRLIKSKYRCTLLQIAHAITIGLVGPLAASSEMEWGVRRVWAIRQRIWMKCC